MPKQITERIIDYPQSAAGRASSYPSGATSTVVALDDHVHDGTLGSGGDLPIFAKVANPLSQFAATTSAQLAGVLSDETGSGAAVFATSPVLVTPALGTPSALVGTNITGTAAGLTAGNVTTNANLTGPITSTGNATAVASQTGTGSKFVMDTSPTLVTPILGVASATSMSITGTLAGSNLTALDSSSTFTQTTAVGVYGVNATIVPAPASDSAASYRGFRGGVRTANATTANFTGSFYGIDADVRHRGTGALANLYGVHTSFGKDNASSGIITNVYGIKTADLLNVTGTITNTYGIHIGDLSAGTQTNAPFSIYSQDPTAIMYHAGKLGLDTTSPTNILSFGGNSARTMWVERGTVADTAGYALTVQAGGATASATDKAGGDLILSPGVSTGTGRANVRIKRYNRGTTGTADNTAADGLIVAGAVNLTDAATSMFEIALAAGASAGGCILWTIRASDGTDMQAYSGVTTFSAVNKAGVYTKTVTSDAGNDAKAVSAGTLTAVFSLLDGTSKVTMQVTPAGSLVETTYQMSYTLFNNSPQAITIL